MKHFSFILFFCLSLLLVPQVQAQEEKQPEQLPALVEEDIIPYLDQIIDWQREVVEMTPQSAREALLREALRQNAKKILQSSFDFARAQAEVLTVTASVAPAAEDAAPTPDDRRKRILTRVAENTLHIKDVQARLAAANRKFASATGSQRANLRVQKDYLNGELKLAQAEKELLGTVMEMFGAGQDSDNGDLASKIAGLSRAVLTEEGIKEAKPAPAETPVKNDASEDFIQSNGIFGLVSSMFAVSNRINALEEVQNHTHALHQSTRDMITALRGSLQGALAEGKALANAPTTSKDAIAQRDAMDALVVRYKQLGAAIIPLGQTSMRLDVSERNLDEWNGLLHQQWNKIFEKLLFRLGVLAVCLLIPLGISKLAKRAIIRYVHDSRRKRQLHILRQVVLGGVLLLVLVLNFVTEFGSLATFAGFLTAGLAVALQTVLVSLTAHFFFFGRFGVRAGDRVTISNVTGDVVQVGMLRIYLMELEGAEDGMRPTGKIVAFPNSVLFNNASAFYKHIAGAGYSWRKMKFLFTSETDSAEARKLTMQAFHEVYEEYKDAIDLQHMTLERSTRLPLEAPALREELQLTGDGLTSIVHYPIMPNRAHEAQERVTMRLSELLRKNGMRLVFGNPMKVETVTETKT